MDRTTSDYNVISPQFPKVVRKDAKGTNLAHRVTKGAFWKVITALASARPDWWFIYYGYDNSNCRIWYEGEELGLLDYNTVGGKFGITSKSIQKALERKSWIHTKSSKKLLKTAIANLTPTPKEVRWLNSATAAVEKMAHTKANLWSSMWYQLQNTNGEVVRFIAQHSQEFAACSKTFDPVKFEGYFSSYNGIDQVQEVINKGEMLVIIKLGGGHYAIGSGSGDWETYTDADLSSDIAEALGALKLMDNGVVMSKYGYRYDDNTFIVIPRKDETCP